MELDFKKMDLVSQKEDQIEKIIYMTKAGATDIKGLAQHIYYNKDSIMIQTLMSMLFKIRSKSLYMIDKVKKSEEYEQTSIFMSEEVIGSLYKRNKKNTYDDIKKRILKNGYIIKDLLLKYYAEKNTNYIENKFFIETILKQKSQKEILSLNPFMINQLLEYQQTPLRQEEQTIVELIDYYIEAQQYYDTPEDIEYVIYLLINNNKAELEKKLLFIISNMYQESKEHKDYEAYSKIARILENPACKPINMIDYVKNNKQAITEIIQKFIEYNFYIPEGRLQELETKPTAQYAKKIYRKNP